MKKLKTIILSAAGLATALIGGGSFALASFAVHGRRQTLEEALRWQADHYDISWYEDLEKQQYVVPSFDGYELHAELCKNPNPSEKYVIITHGYTDNRYGSLKYMRIYLDLGFNCIIYDLRGHGVNEKTFCSYSIRESQDLEKMIEDTKRRYGFHITLGLHGESLGAASTAAVLGLTQDVDFAVADCGFADIENVLKVGLKQMHLPTWMVHLSSIASRIRYGYSFSQMQPIKALRNNQVPILFLHGAEDTFIVPDNSRRMSEATAGYREFYTLPGAGHAESVLKAPELYRQHVTEFLGHVLP